MRGARCAHTGTDGQVRTHCNRSELIKTRPARCAHTGADGQVRTHCSRSELVKPPSITVGLDSVTHSVAPSITVGHDSAGTEHLHRSTCRWQAPAPNRRAFRLGDRHGDGAAPDTSIAPSVASPSESLTRMSRIASPSSGRSTLPDSFHNSVSLDSPETDRYCYPPGQGPPDHGNPTRTLKRL